MIKDISAITTQVGSMFGSIGSLTASAGNLTAKAAMGAGYYVQTTTFLFKLNWNPEISETFYQTLWDNPDANHASDIFSRSATSERDRLGLR